MKKLLIYLKSNRYHSFLISWCLLVTLVTYYLVSTIPFYRSLKINFTPNIFDTAEIIVKSKGHEFPSFLSARELEQGQIVIPGGKLLRFQGVLNKDHLNIKEEKFFWNYRLNQIRNNFFIGVKDSASGRIVYNGPEVKINSVEFTNFIHKITCLFSAIIVVTTLFSIVYVGMMRPIPYKGIGFFLLNFSWMLFHLFANWPGVLGYDGVVNYSDSLDLMFTSFIQPLTTIINASFFNFYPHYVWNTLFTILGMSVTIGVLANYFIKDKISLIIFTGLIFFFYFCPINTFTNLFINRDAFFSWVFFCATIIPIILKVTKKTHSLVGHVIFLFLLTVSIEIRKEVLALLPFAIIWSYTKLNTQKSLKLSLYACLTLFIYFTMFGNEFLRNMYSSPIYQATTLVNPIGDVISQKGLVVLTSSEKSNLEKFADLNVFAKNYSAHDINPYPYGALQVNMTKENLIVLTNLYFRLMKSYPDIWIQNRIKVLIGSFGLNSLRPNYAHELRNEVNIPLEYDSTLHVMPIGDNKIIYPEFLKSWKAKYWDLNSELDFNHFVFSSLAIPVILLIFSVPYLFRVPATAFSLLLNLTRMGAMFPFLPATYIKYVYPHYLMFLFIPLFIYIELKSERKKV